MEPPTERAYALSLCPCLCGSDSVWVARLVSRYSSNTASFVVCVFRDVKDHHNLPHYSPRSKNTCVRQVVLDKWFPLIFPPSGPRDLQFAGARGKGPCVYVYISYIHNTCISIYIYRERERDIHIYIYVYTIYIYTYREREREGCIMCIQYCIIICFLLLLIIIVAGRPRRGPAGYRERPRAPLAAVPVSRSRMPKRKCCLQSRMPKRKLPVIKDAKMESCL